MSDDIAAGSGPERHSAAWDMRFDSRDIGVFLHDVVGEFVGDSGGPARGISWALTVLRSGQVLTLAAGSAPARAVDEAQAAFEDSPARTALDAGELVLVPDIRLERRWPGYASTAAGLGVGSLLAVPLLPADAFRTVLSLYAPWPHVFTSADMMAAVRFARELSRDLRLAQGLALGARGEAELTSAQLSRTLAGLVVRTLVREHGYTVEASLDYLRTLAGNLPGPEVVPVQVPMPVPVQVPVPVPIPAADQDARGIQSVPGLPAARTGEPHGGRRKRRRTETPA